MTPTNTRKDSSPSWSRLRNQQQQKRKNWKRPKEGARVFLFSLLPLSCSLTFGSVLLLTPSPPRFFSLSLLSLFSLSFLSSSESLAIGAKCLRLSFSFQFFFRARGKSEREERERREREKREREDRHCARAWLWRERRKRRERERREREKRERREAFNLDLSPTWRTWT